MKAKMEIPMMAIGNKAKSTGMGFILGQTEMCIEASMRMVKDKGKEQ